MTMGELIAIAGVYELDISIRKMERKLQKVISFADGFQPIIIKRSAGGKRLRPMFTLLSAMASGHQIDDDVISRATAAEMIHQASLLHDKVIDAEAKDSIADMILAGDYMIAQALASAPDYEAVKILANCVTDMTKGQALQLSSGYRPLTDDTTYLKSTSLKTASLFAASCKLGAYSNTGLEEFGLKFGIAFQLIDDVTDKEFTPDEDKNAEQAAKKNIDEAIDRLSALPDSDAKRGLINLASYYLETSLPSAG